MRKHSHYIRGFLALLSFLTIIPTRVYDVALAAEYFYLIPIVGFIEGLIAVLPLLMPIPLMLKAALTLLLLYVLTGFNHLDGFADFVDAIMSKRSNEEALKIMKEPWRGTMAIASVVLLIILTYVSIIILAEGNKWYVIVLAQILTFESSFILAVLSNPPTYQGLGRLFVTKVKRSGKIIANIALALVAVFSILIPYITDYNAILTLIFMVSTTLLTVLYVYIKAHSILGYSTGDVLGFCLELSRLVNLLTASILLSIG